MIENGLSLPALFCAPNSHFLGVLPSSGGRGKIDQDFLIQCFEWVTAVKHDIAPLRPRAGSWDPQGWLASAVSSLYQRKAQEEQSLQPEWMMKNI